uniref:hypothetical protein n=1 Tax=Staphylococcus hominis TaxID=1290 RepID=UPI001C931600
PYTLLPQNIPNLHPTLTFQQTHYTNPLPNNPLITPITYYQHPLQSNFTNSINLPLHTTPPTFPDVTPLQHKYYRRHNLNISIPLSHNPYRSGVEDPSITQNTALQPLFNTHNSGH